MHQLVKNVSDEQIINDILYRVAIHELGHNLNLRHNFYGSVDAKTPDVPTKILVQENHLCDGLSPQ